MTAKDLLTIAKREYDAAKAELFKQDPDWVAAKEELRDANAKEAEAKEDATGSVGTIGASRDARQAAQMAAAARSVISRGEAKIRSLQAQNNYQKPQNNNKKRRR